MPVRAHKLIEELRLGPDGAQPFTEALDRGELACLVEAFSGQAPDLASVRLFGVAALAPFLTPTGPIGSIATSMMARVPRPVRAILFDKTPTVNWALGWHQDRVIAVRERVEFDGFAPWTRKHGAVHVAPPFEVLADMVTLRVHLDPVPSSNAPLLIAPGSHKLGRITEQEIQNAVRVCGVAACLAKAGDVWAYATPILHASERAEQVAHRRVLQVDYSHRDLLGGLQWLGV